MSTFLVAPPDHFVLYPFEHGKGDVYLGKTPLVAYLIEDDLSVELIPLASVCRENLSEYGIWGGLLMPDGSVHMDEQEFSDADGYLKYCERRIANYRSRK